MYELGFYVPFSISVISGRWKGKHERLCAMKHCFINSIILIYIFIHNFIFLFFYYIFPYHGKGSILCSLGEFLS